jgi:hypothetical protein
MRTIIALLSLLLVSCTASSDYMKPAEAPRVLVAPPDAALVVFARYDDGAIINNITLFTDSSRFLGDVPPDSWFVATLAPGDYIFLGRGKNPSPLVASLAPGRVYFVEVALELHNWNDGSKNGTRYLKLYPRAPQAPEWSRMLKAFKEAQFNQADLASGQAKIDAKREGFAKLIDEARVDLEDDDGETRRARTLPAEWGVAQFGR